MKITLTFDSDNEVELDHAAGLVAYLQDAEAMDEALDRCARAGQAVKETAAPAAGAVDKKAQAAADKKAKDAEAAAAKKAEEEAAAAAAKKAEEEAAAAAAKKAEDEAAASEDDDFLGGDGADEQPELTLEQVRQALTDYSKIEGRPAAIKILNEQGGVKSIGELPKDKFRAVYDAAQVKKK